MFGVPLQWGPATRRLLASRFLRSAAQGALAVDFALYLNALGWGAGSIGLVLSGGALVNAGMAALIGPVADRLGRRRSLLAYQALTCASAFAAVFTRVPIWLGLAAVLGSLGRGANGSIAGFAPAEQAWLAEGVAPADRPRLYGLNEGLGFAGMGLGATAAASPALLGRWLSGPNAYEPLLIGVSLAFLASLLVLVPAPEQRIGDRAQKRNAGKPDPAPGVGALWRLVVANAFNGFGLGLAEPLIAYWFLLRYGVGPAAIAPVLAAMYFATGVSSIGGGWLAEHLGLIRTVVVARIAGLALLVGLPLMPSYGAAALVYLLRAVFNRGTLGLRQSLVVGLVAPERRGLAVSVNAVSNQLTQTPGPYVAASLFGEGALALPFYVAALFQGTYLVLYARFFSAYEPPRRHSAGVRVTPD